MFKPSIEVMSVPAKRKWQVINMAFATKKKTTNRPPEMQRCLIFLNCGVSAFRIASILPAATAAESLCANMCFKKSLKRALKMTRKTIKFTWYQEYALLAGSYRITTILAPGTRANASLAALALSKYVALLS